MYRPCFRYFEEISGNVILHYITILLEEMIINALQWYISQNIREKQDRE